MIWKVVYTKHAQKDAKKLTLSGLKSKAMSILELLKKNPCQNPLPHEKLSGDLAGTYSRRINIRHRIVYQILKKQQTVKILRMWTHYE